MLQRSDFNQSAKPQVTTRALLLFSSSHGPHLPSHNGKSNHTRDKRRNPKRTLYILPPNSPTNRKHNTEKERNRKHNRHSQRTVQPFHEMETPACNRVNKIRSERQCLVYRANPHLTLRVRQATAYVTSRRSTDPRFNSSSPILTHHHPPSPAFLCAVHRLTSTHSPVLPKYANLRSHGCRERQLLARRIQGSSNRSLVPG
jgi:hypothetical protein